MYREIQPKEEINVLLDDGGLGDCIARLPAVKYVMETHPHVQVRFWVPDYFVDFAKRSLPKDVITRSYTDAKTKYNTHLPGRAFSVHIHTNLSTHMTDHAFSILCNKNVEPEVKNYLKPDTSDINLFKFHLPEKFVVITTGFTAEVREMRPDIINTIVSYIKSKGYEVVFLGKEETFNGVKHIIKGTFKAEIDFTQGLNLINKTNLLESHAVISKAKTIVGLDNGLLHVAGCTDIPIVGGYTTVEPKYRMPYRNNVLGWNYYPVVPPESLNCRFCQSNWTFTYEHDFKTCYYKDYECTKQLSANRYIEQLEKIL